MNRLLNKQQWFRGTLIVLGSLGLTALGIFASDMSRGIEGRLPGLVGQSGGSGCGAGAVLVALGTHSICMDIYEASPGTQCPHATPQNEVETATNITTPGCEVESAAERYPWRFVSYTQAQQMCARSGKRLPTNLEWYRVAMGIADTSSCVVDQSSKGPLPTGSRECVAPQGVYDLVGNVWEWMDETIVDGQYDNRDLPDAGYITLVDGQGVVITTDTAPQSDFANTYASIQREGVRGMLRGGFYGSGEEGGIWSQNLAATLDIKTAGIGFRCVRDL